jgi:hypothetical protein
MQSSSLQDTRMLRPHSSQTGMAYRWPPTQPELGTGRCNEASVLCITATILLLNITLAQQPTALSRQRVSTTMSQAINFYLRSSD